MLAVSRNKPSISVRYYLWCEGELFRIAKKLHHEILDGKVPVPALANSRQKVVEVFAEALTASVRKVNARGSFYEFDAQGFVDGRARLQAAVEALGIGTRFASGIVDLEQILKTRRFRDETNWSVPKVVFDKIKGDVLRDGSGTSKIRRFKAADRHPSSDP